MTLYPFFICNKTAKVNLQGILAFFARKTPSTIGECAQMVEGVMSQHTRRKLTYLSEILILTAKNIV